MPVLEFVAQSAVDVSNPGAVTERLVNLYPEPMQGAVAQLALKSVPGMTRAGSFPGLFVRAMAVSSGAVFAAQGGRLFQVGSDGQATDRGAIGDDVDTAICGAITGEITVTSGGDYFVWNGATLSQPTPGAFSDFGSVAFLGGYTILTERDGNRFCWSALADPTSLPALNFATAEGHEDKIVRALAVGGYLWLFGERTIEIWGLSGLPNEDAFVRIGGAVVSRGLQAFGLACEVPDGVFFVGDDGVAYLTAGAALRPVSTPAVNVALASGEATAAFYYEHQGHKFCVLRFGDRPAWCYDLATGLWHERAGGGIGGAWEVVAAVPAFGGWLAGGRDGGLYRLDGWRDGDGPLIRRAVSRRLYLPGRGAVVHEAELFGHVGAADIGREAQAIVRFSRDGGRTWGSERRLGMGRLGEFDRRLILRSLGHCKSLVAEVVATDPTDLTLWSAVDLRAA